jgi:hypothetical protein
MEKYKNEKGLVGVLVFDGHGAGWSTSSSDNALFMAMDRTLVEMKLRKADKTEVVKYLEGVLGRDIYISNWEKVKVEYLEEGTIFTIDSYDGWESICTLAHLNMIA